MGSLYRILHILSFLLLLSGVSCAEASSTSVQLSDTIAPVRPEVYRLVFAGDIMAHGPQIKAARTAEGMYDFTSSFDSLASRVSSADLAFGNLETTFGGKPYTGYPMFSTPDAMGTALREAGFDVLTTSNNHSADRSALGITRTLDVLDSLGIAHTGSYRSVDERKRTVPLMLELGSLRLAVLAYTYGTNGLTVPEPTLVDGIDTLLMAQDIARADSLGANYKIVQIHWGVEYERAPNREQRALARWLHGRGVDAIVGSHPHVVQQSEWIEPDSLQSKKSFVIYSLGNFVSNQRKPAATRGGMLLSLTLSRANPTADIVTQPSYQYVFVNKLRPDGRAVYRLLPVDLPKAQVPVLLPRAEQVDLQDFCSYYSAIPMVR